MKLQTPKFSLIWPVAALIIVLGLLALFKPIDPEAPVVNSNQEVDQVKILVREPLTTDWERTQPVFFHDYIHRNLYESLTILKNAQLEPQLAQSWKNSDNLTWEFKIDRNKKFSNGTDLQARDVKFSLEESKRQGWPIPSPLHNIYSSEIVDPETLVFKTSVPIPNLPLLLKGLPILSQEAYGQSPRQLLGTGPYRVTQSQITKNDGIEEVALEPNPHYSPAPLVGRMLFYHYDSKNLLTITKDNLAGFDLIEEGVLPSNLVGRLNLFFTPSTISLPEVNVLYLNTQPTATRYFNQDTNPLADPRVREAIALTIESSKLIQDSNVSGKPSLQLAARSVFGFDPGIGIPSPNRKRAEELLREAGLEKGFEVTLDWPLSSRIEGESLARQLNEVGIEARLSLLSESSLMTKAQTGEFAILRDRWVNDYFDSTSVFIRGFYSTGNRNYTSYRNIELDDKVEVLNTTFDYKERQKLQKEMMGIALKGLNWLPLWEPGKKFWVRDDLDFIPTDGAILGTEILGKN
jgi:peptide/nickel transport system substrate-binding protein